MVPKSATWHHDSVQGAPGVHVCMIALAKIPAEALSCRLHNPPTMRAIKCCKSRPIAPMFTHRKPAYRCTKGARGIYMCGTTGQADLNTLHSSNIKRS